MADEQIKVSTAVDNTGFSTGLDSIKEQSAKFGESIKEEFGGAFQSLSSVGIAAAGGLVAALDLVKDAIGEDIEKAAQLANASERFGVGTTALQQMGNAAEQNGASLNDVTAAYNKLTVNSQEAIEGNKEMTDAFADLGVSVDDLKSKSLEDIMNQIADGTANATDKGAAYASVVQVLGKSAGNLFDTLNLGSEKIREVGNASGVMSDFTVRSLDNMEKASKSFWGNFTAWVGNAFTSAYVGADTLYITFQTAIEGMTEIVVAFVEYLSHPFSPHAWDDFKDQFSRAIADASDEAKDRINKLVHPDAEAEDPKVRAARAGEDGADSEKVKAAQKAQDEIDKINAEAAEKEAKARYDSLTFAQKIQLQKNAIYQEGFSLNSGDKLQEARARLAIASAQETLVALEKLDGEAKRKSIQSATEAEHKINEIKLRAAEETAEKKLSAEEAQLKKLEELHKKDNPQADQLRKIGGGLAGVNYAVNAKDVQAQSQIDLLKQQIDIQKQQLAVQKSIATPDSQDDGSYTVGG